MLTNELKLEIKELFKETPWNIEDINTITDEEIKNKLLECANHPISNQDILIACRSYNFAYLKGRALLRKRASEILRQLGVNIEEKIGVISNEDILIACDSLNFAHLYQRAVEKAQSDELIPVDREINPQHK